MAAVKKSKVNQAGVYTKPSMRKALFDKIKDMYEIVFLITHNDLVKDWGDNVLTINKKDNISALSIK